MESITYDFKINVTAKLLNEKNSRGLADRTFYDDFDIDRIVMTQMMSHEFDGLMTDGAWLRLGRKLGVTEVFRKWNMARTAVFDTIEEDIIFCQENAKAKICVDECGIGKTFTAKYLSKTRKNCFYVDASQGKTISMFTKVLAKAIGLEATGKFCDIKEDIKCYLKMIDSPIVIVDEAGDLGQVALQEIKEYWNATEGFCGWYLMGADGLRYTIEKGIKSRKPGFKEIFSRFSEKYTTTVPLDLNDRHDFYRKLIADVLRANMVDRNMISEITKRCLIKTKDGAVSGLRRAESLLILFAKQNNLNPDNNEHSEKVQDCKVLQSSAAVC